MKFYVGAKVIKAEPAKATKDSFNVKKGDDGYKVIYPDGYVSWSPKKVFEEAYHEVPMDFITEGNDGNMG